MNAPLPPVAVVSGAGSGIGAAIARALAERGETVALIGRRREPLEALARSTAGRTVAFPGDVRDAARMREIAATIAGDLGEVETVVAAAGVAHVAPFVELADEALRESVEVNLLGTAYLFRAFLPAMMARGRGTLVPLLSVAARKAFPGWSAYCAGKWGTLGLVEALRGELEGSGVRIVALTPGATETPLWDEVAGAWNRERMIPAVEVARALIWALAGGERVAIEEIRMQPPGGDL